MTNNSHLKKIPPIFISCCNQNPVTINLRKLIDSHHANIQITTTQIAYLLALIEAKAKTFDPINLDDHLQVRVQELRECLSVILEKKICQYLRCSPDDQSTPQSFWIEKWNLNQDDNKTSEYLLSWSTAQKLLLQTRESACINVEYLNAIIKIQQKTKERERKSKLERLNLMDELSQNLSNYCTSSPVKLNLKKLPNKIWLNFIAGYLAISAKQYPDYGDLDPSDNSLINNMKRTHGLLLKSLSEKIKFPLTKFENMSSEQRQITKDAGIIDIALVAHSPSVEVTNDLALDLLKKQSEFDYLFNETQEDEANIDAIILNSPQTKTTDQITTIANNYFNSELSSKTLEEYLDDAINIAVISTILPKLLPNKKEKLNKKQLNKLYEKIFNQLSEVLNENGCFVTDNLPQKNKKDGQIKGKDKSGNVINLSYEALSKRVNPKLLYIYQNNLQHQIDNI